MKGKISTIAKLINHTFLTLKDIDLNKNCDDFIYISNDDRYILKQIYKSFGINKYIKGYKTFEGFILDYSINRMLPPIESAIEIGKNITKTNG